MKSQAPEWENIFSIRITNKGLMSRTYKEQSSYKLIRKTSNAHRQIGEDLRYITRENIQMANEHLRRFNLFTDKRNKKENHSEVPQSSLPWWQTF